jgi:hypothetical protein
VTTNPPGRVRPAVDRHYGSELDCSIPSVRKALEGGSTIAANQVRAGTCGYVTGCTHSFMDRKRAALTL